MTGRMFRIQNHAMLPELTTILLTRLGFLWLLVLLSLLLPAGDIAFYAFMGIAFIITVPYSLWLRNKLRTTQFASLQFLVDLILVTGLVYFTGGMNSELILLYPLVILSAGIVGTPKQAMEITLLTIVMYSTMAILISNGLLVEYVPAEKTLPKQAPGMTAFLHCLTFLLFSGASIYVSRLCKYTHAHRKELTQTFETLLSGMPGAILLLDHEGYILFANETACSLLHTDAESLGATPFKDLLSDGPHRIPEQFGSSSYIALPDQPPRPVSYESSDIRILETALLGSNGRKGVEISVTLLKLNEISHALEAALKLQKVERITAATHIAGEMAHEIRTPLTAISASIQLLRHYEDRTTAADWLPNSPRRNDRRELFNHIEDASSRMNTAVSNFISFTEFSPQDLLSIIKLDSAEQNKG